MQKTFIEQVYDVVKQIPVGKVATYRDIATFVGRPNAARAVGSAMKNNPDLETVPCYRVIGSDGKMHGYAGAGGVQEKIERLKKEGVVFIGDLVDLSQCRWANIGL